MIFFLNIKKIVKESVHMIKLIKKMYYCIICYDPVIEILKKDNKLDFDYKKEGNIYIASTLQPNRKLKRQFLMEYKNRNGKNNIIE